MKAINNNLIAETEIKKNIFNKLRYGKYFNVINEYLGEITKQVNGSTEEEEYRNYYMSATRWK